MQWLKRRLFKSGKKEEKMGSELVFEEEDPRSLLKPNKTLGLLSKTLLVDGVPKMGEDSASLVQDMDEWLKVHCKWMLVEFHVVFRERVNTLSVTWEIDE